jgi:hypothetical protein
VFAGYADAACKQPVASKESYDAPCPLDAALSFGTGRSCTSASFFALGPALSEAYSLQPDGSCTGQPVLGGGLAYGVGAPIPTTTLPLTSFVLQGAAPVQLRVAAFDGHPVLRTGKNVQFGGTGSPQNDAFVDAASGVSCEPLPAADGKTRCMPDTNGVLVFADAACALPVFVFFPDTCSKPPFAPPPIAGFGTNGTWHVRTVGAPLPASQPTWAADSTGACMPSAPITNGAVYYALGNELPPTRFTEVTVVTE